MLRGEPPAAALASCHRRAASVAALTGASALLFVAYSAGVIAPASPKGASFAPAVVSAAESLVAASQSLLPVRLALQAAPDKCVSVRREGPDDGKDLVLWDCSTTPDAFVVPEGFAQGQIRWASRPSLCLETGDGQRLRLWDCSQPPLVSLNFKVGRGSHGAIRWAAHPEKCVRVAEGDGYRNGARLGIGDCGSEGDKETNFDLQIVRLDCAGISWTWSEWSSCSQPCGGGYRLRSRKVDVSEGGGTCHGFGGETKRCNTMECTPELLAQLSGHGRGYATVYGGPLQPVRISLLADRSKCVAVEQAEPPARRRLQLQDCSDAPSQFLIPKGFGHGPIRWAEESQLCLDAPAGKQLHLQNCSAVTQRSSHFSIDARAGHGTVSLASLPYKCLALPGTADDAGAEGFLQVLECDDAEDRLRRFGFTFFYEECRWADWSEWSACSCSKGLRTRSRKPEDSDSDGLCAGAGHQEKRCTPDNCHLLA